MGPHTASSNLDDLWDSWWAGVEQLHLGSLWDIFWPWPPLQFRVRTLGTSGFSSGRTKIQQKTLFNSDPSQNACRSPQFYLIPTWGRSKEAMASSNIFSSSFCLLFLFHKKSMRNKNGWRCWINTKLIKFAGPSLQLSPIPICWHHPDHAARHLTRCCSTWGPWAWDRDCSSPLRYHSHGNELACSQTGRWLPRWQGWQLRSFAGCWISILAGYLSMLVGEILTFWCSLVV